MDNTIRNRLTLRFTAIFVMLFVFNTSNAALLSRLGGLAYYDTALDITWLADLNLAESNTFGLAYGAELGMHANDNHPATYSNTISTNGRMTWGASLFWLDAMNADGGTGYLGFSDWRLPTMMDTAGPGCESADFTPDTDCNFNVQTGDASTTVFSEMASLYYDTLGNLSLFDENGNQRSCSDLISDPNACFSNRGPFINTSGSGGVSSFYWTGLEYDNAVQPLDSAWYFDVGTSFQYFWEKETNLAAMVVRSGDVLASSAVPLPATVWLFGSGLIGLVSFGRRKRG